MSLPFVRRVCVVRARAGRVAVAVPLLAGLLAAPVLQGAGFVAPAVSAAPAKAAAKKFPVPAGRIVYNMSGFMGMNGTMTMIWVGNGQKFRQDMAMRMPAMPNGGMNTWMISDGKFMYTSNPMMGKKVMRMKIPTQAAAASAMTMPGMNVTGAATGGKLVGRANVLGKPCEVRLMTVSTPQMDMRMKMWMWRGLALKMENAMKMKSAPKTSGGATPRIPNINMTMTATKLDLNPKLSPALFKVPAGYTIQDAPAAGGRGMPVRR